MCGRFAQYSDYDTIVGHFSINNKVTFTPSYNITPNSPILAIVNDDHERKLIKLRWGFIPSWTKINSKVSSFINARAETIDKKPSFRSAFRHQRCLIIANGFYEWKVVGNNKVPYYIHAKHSQLISFAGIWDHWYQTNEAMIWTCAIITKHSYGELQQLHDRMPVIVSENHYNNWLDKDATTNQLMAEILSTDDSPELTFYRVTPKLNNPYFNNPHCMQAVTD